ncbi:XRE family transcriptional regulator [Bradyrhizobium sp. SZCCHNR1051]|uniref:ImmA/IrrE family metallo-endopeptidase n=1 Tax=Bradyrhizobium sp. SZCCHNR1051 TaxID=3057355 RepID=UPI002916733F|nr:XRE family transcriptional regulator [Bradyrhizobium sp. SZCCHNR1051]
MAEYVNSGLLRVARQRLGFSQGEAADRLAVPQVTLSRYENAVASPPDEFIARAASIYGMPIEFFRQPDAVFGPPVSVHPMWRKKADVTVRDIDKIIAEINIRALQIRRLLSAVEYTPQSDIPRLDLDDYDGDIERIAGLVRAHWLLPNGPIENLTAAVERAGAVVIYSSMGGSSVSGVTVSVPGLLPVIVLNRDQTGDRQRFTLAHELGHLVMHKFPSPDMETEANNFASALLMPKNEITLAFRSRKIDMARLAALKPEWRVSMQALLYRAQSLGLIEKPAAGWLWRKFAMDRTKTREPSHLDFPPEQPGVINRMIRLHLDNFGYSTGELAKIIHANDNMLNEYYDLTAGSPVQGMKLRVVR